MHYFRAILGPFFVYFIALFIVSFYAIFINLYSFLLLFDKNN